MSAEYADLPEAVQPEAVQPEAVQPEAVQPEAVQREAQAFADIHIAWLCKVLVSAKLVTTKDSEARARAIFAAVSGAQLVARSRSDISQFDNLIESYRASGLLPG